MKRRTFLGSVFGGLVGLFAGNKAVASEPKLKLHKDDLKNGIMVFNQKMFVGAEGKVKMEINGCSIVQKPIDKNCSIAGIIVPVLEDGFRRVFCRYHKLVGSPMGRAVFTWNVVDEEV